MLAPVATIVISVAAGAALGSLPGVLPRVTSPIRTFAVVSGLAVVCLHFLPHALESSGVWGLLVAVASFALSTGLDRFAPRGSKAPRRSEGSVANIGLGLGYSALLLHRLGDGAAMAASAHGPGVLWAVGAHAVPIVALVTLAYRRKSRAASLGRAAGLGLASFASYFLVQSVPALMADGFHGYVDAVASGILVGVVVNELRGEAPRATGERLLDVASGGLGLLLVLGPGATGMEDEHISLVERFVELSVQTAPTLLIGLMGGALLQALRPTLPVSWLSPRSPPMDALRGTIYGAPLPLCSCSVLPLSRSLLRGGAGPALVVAFLIATPELGIETLTLSVQLLGWPFALLRLCGALGVAFVAGIVVAKLAPRPKPGARVSTPFCATHAGSSPTRRFLHALEDLFLHVGGWLLLGLAAAAYADVLIPTGALKASGSAFFQLLVMTAMAVPSYVCAPSATPVAAALMAKGLAPGTVLVGLLLGPATNFATLLFLRHSFGLRPLAVMLMAVTACSWALAAVANLLIDPRAVSVTHQVHETGPLQWMGLCLLLLLLARTVWSTGIRGWLAASLLEGPTSDHEGHAHGHDHGHLHVPTP